MLYRILKIPAAISFWMYCRQLRVNNKDAFKTKGPLLIACNHPNSFLDAIILSSLFKRPVYSLARGDAFKNKWIAAILRSLKMLPVYRTSEGVENMEHNYTTFEACKEIFKKNGIVLIFSEGRCINEWHLRPLMKGTARLAINSWEEGIDLAILPTGINYQSFSVFGKNIDLNFGSIITQNDIDTINGFGKSILTFNQLLEYRLAPLVYEIDKNDLATLQQKMAAPVYVIKKICLAVPAAIGYIIHFPLYYAAKKLASKDEFDNDHYDSILFGILFLSYPLYLIANALLIFLFTGGYWWLAILLLPFCGWSYMMLKKQL
ncbi:MAG TPA: 1-acyl-sn-glycerol-3-phosphate acyltransferase [Ferruginibacter sp.]|nr:1-acyl-sn-glycerol-3-phosphate acyltransferase [Ferruginibacter sp.]